MTLPYGYTLLTGPPVTPPPNGYSYAPGTDGHWYSFPTPGVDNSLLGGAVSANGAGADTGATTPTNPYDDPLGLRKYLPDWLNPDRGGGVDARPIEKAVASSSTALDFITDIPRVLTALIGVILIIAGIFALAKGPAIQVVGSAIKDAATS